jgi:lipopolysaccharide transport system ATP-binding protein
MSSSTTLQPERLAATAVSAAAAAAAVVPPGPRSEPAVVVRDLGKCYEIYARPADRLKQTLWRGRRQFFREFWALRGVSFEVQRGESVGIIGRNGSGKSTLLQIIAGTLRPSEGRVDVHGRVHALLELGSGFNPEFTGRENVFLNGAVLGLSARDIEQRFDAIASFADIGEFIEQPIKTYSSGMVVRLAFAVQALLEPDLLIVDEALAVGDEGFQRKCFGWLERFQSRGGSILFVTHSTQLVVRLCRRGLLLERGRLMAHGASKAVGDIYQKLLYGSPEQTSALQRELQRVGGSADALEPEQQEDQSSPAGVAIECDAAEDSGAQAHTDVNLVKPAETSYGNGDAEITDVATCDEQGRPANVLVAGRPFQFRYRVRFHAAAADVRCGMMIKTVEGVDVAGMSSTDFGYTLERAAAGQVLSVAFRMVLNLQPGVYFFNSGVSAMKSGGLCYLHRRVDVAAMRVIPCDDRDGYGIAFMDGNLAWSLADSTECVRA